MIWRKKSVKVKKDRTVTKESVCYNSIRFEKLDDSLMRHLELKMTNDVDISVMSFIGFASYSLNKEEAIEAARAILSHFGVEME